MAFHVEHVVPRQHKGSSDIENLALACPKCNLNKGTNLTTVDPETGLVVPIFNPRLDNWTDHFRLSSGTVIGITDIGRATVRLLRMNVLKRIELRKRFAPG